MVNGDNVLNVKHFMKINFLHKRTTACKQTNTLQSHGNGYTTPSSQAVLGHFDLQRSQILVLVAAIAFDDVVLVDGIVT
jgi:hypothetical protein